MITSVQNPRIKNILKLEKIRERRKQGLIVVEGAREIAMAAGAGYKIESIFSCSELNDTVTDQLIHKLHRTGTFVYNVSVPVFEKIACRKQSDGIIATVIPEYSDFKDVRISSNPFVIVLEAIEKPGNLGAVLRTADAAHADLVIVCDPHTDIYNPNTIRSSIGCVFTQPIVTGTNEETLHWLKGKKINIFAAELTASVWYHQTDFSGPSAIVIGTEAAGLTDFWLGNAFQRIKIPMCGTVDSLNVSVSTAVITFEAMRQRGFQNMSAC